MRTISAVFNVSMDYLYGIESGPSISTFGLSEEQAELIRDLSELIRDQNSVTLNKSKLSARQYEMMGRIFACFMGSEK